MSVSVGSAADTVHKQECLCDGSEATVAEEGDRIGSGGD
jgi:hypothetical protein